MKQYKIKIEGSGTENQLAIRLLEIGRRLQLEETEDLVDKTIEDSILVIEIEED